MPLLLYIPAASSMPAMACKHSEGQTSTRWKGVRKRAWGKWVCEIRRPHSRQRIWLGSYATAEEAARAYDAASLCLRGPSASLNYPCSSIPPLLLWDSTSHRPPLSRKAIQSIAAAAAAEAAAQNDAAAAVQNEEWTVAEERQALTLIRQELQAPTLIPSQEMQAPMHNQMEFPSHEMQVSIQHQIGLPLQSNAPMHNQIEFPSQEMQASNQHQIHLPSQSAIPMQNQKEFPSQEMQASNQQQIRLPSETATPRHNNQIVFPSPMHNEIEFPPQEMQASTQQQIHLPSQIAAPMHNEIKFNEIKFPSQFPSHEMQASTQHQIRLPSQSIIPGSAFLTPPSGCAPITLLSSALPNPSADHTPNMLHPNPSVHNARLAIPAMAKHFRGRSQMRENHSPGFTCSASHPFLELVDKEDDFR